jgi:hypothetical protein
MNILPKYLDCQLFGLLFPKFGRIFFQSSGHPVRDPGTPIKDMDKGCGHNPINLGLG